MFRTVPLSIIRSFSLYTQQWYMSYSSQAVSKPVWHMPLLCVQWKTPDEGQRNCPKCVEFYSKNNFEKFSASSWFYYKNLVRLIQWILVFIRVKRQVELWLYYIWLPNRALEDNSVGTKYCQAFPEFYREYNFHLLFFFFHSDVSVHDLSTFSGICWIFCCHDFIYSLATHGLLLLVFLYSLTK